jgi:hypothetical protein
MASRDMICPDKQQLNIEKHHKLKNQALHSYLSTNNQLELPLAIDWTCLLEM